MDDDLLKHALGDALFARAGDVSHAVLHQWKRQRAGAAASDEVYRDIVRTTELATITVAQFLTTGSLPSREQSKALAAVGKAPLRDTISLKELTRLYLFWRDATIEAVKEVARDLDAGRDVVDYAVGVVQAGFDGSIVRMTREFDEERARLQARVREDQERLRYQALHDALTGLANRLLFRDRVDHALELAARRLTRCGVIFVDLDRFKQINDVAGHAIGDEVLVEVAHRLCAAVRTSDSVARLGGDEFVVLCEDIGGEEEAGRIAARIAELLADPVLAGDREFFTSASIGIALASPSVTADALISQADRAMYLAKQRGRARFEFYRLDIDKGLERRSDLLHALHRACERSEFELHYQPLTALHADRVTDMEALLRWNHPELGVIPPMEFIPLAEETGLITEIGRWVLRRACADCAQWRRNGMPDVGVTINLSGRQLEDACLVRAVRDAIDDARLAADVVTLELTESVLFSDAPAVHDALEELHSIGVHLAIDDFGTGYSSLSYLSKFPIDVVKIDRSFVSGLTDTGRNKTIVFATVELAHSLGLTVVAEGVETEHELAQLRDARCDVAQGFLLGRPQPLPAHECASRKDAPETTG
jgi:diguanylate cyclase (GGDEF)-like protein